MGIKETVPWQTRYDWQPMDLEQLEYRGIEVVPDEIQCNPDSDVFEWNGKLVLVYIRDQHESEESMQKMIKEGKSRYKYHFTKCKTLADMKNKDRLDSRYVVTTRKDGLFLINFLVHHKPVPEDYFLRMDVCRCCLIKINYKNYKENREKVFKEFSIDEYFRIYGNQLTVLPKHNERTMPKNEYSLDWPRRSTDMREKRGWKCEKCGRCFHNQRHKLHIHHINGQKSDNRPENLKALCEDCHAEEHEHLRNNIITKNLNKK